MPSYFVRVVTSDPDVLGFAYREAVRGQMIQGKVSIVRFVRSEPESEVTIYYGTKKVPSRALQPSLREFHGVIAGISGIKEAALKQSGEVATVQFRPFDPYLRLSEEELRELRQACNRAYLARKHKDGESRPVLMKTGCQLATT